MPSDIYQKLRESIDQVGNGFPATTSGVELRLLKKLFDEEEAKIYTSLTDKLETPESIAKRAGEDPGKVAKILNRMKEKGLVFPGRKGELRYYAAAPFAHGFLEHQVERMDKEFLELLQEWVTAEKVSARGSGPLPMKPIPVNEAVGLDKSVSPHDDIKGLLKRHDRIAVARCFCATQNRMTGGQCDQPLEVCFFLDFYADYYVENGWARWVNHEEAIEILDRCRDHGLVCQPVNTKNPGAICNCCFDCCWPSQAIKMYQKPAELVISNYYARVDPELCTACETCLDRCPTEAIVLNPENTAEVNRDRCIGCGLCTVTCPTEALTLQKKPEGELREPPDINPFMKGPEVFESEME